MHNHYGARYSRLSCRGDAERGLRLHRKTPQCGKAQSPQGTDWKSAAQIRGAAIGTRVVAETRRFDALRRNHRTVVADAPGLLSHRCDGAIDRERLDIR